MRAPAPSTHRAEQTAGDWVGNDRYAETEIAGPSPIPVRFWTGGVGRSTILYVHGLMSHAGWFVPSGNWLSERGLNCVAFDRRGSGRSAAPRGDLGRYEDMLDELTRVVDWCQTRFTGAPIHLAGQCFGCLPVLSHAAREGRSVHSLVLLSPGLRTHATLSLWQKGLVAALVRIRPNHPIPVPLAVEDFTDEPAPLAVMRADALRLTDATVRLYRETSRMRRDVERAAPLIARPVFMALAERDSIADNRAAARYFERLVARPKRCRVYARSLHSIEHGARRESLLNDWCAWVLEHED